MVHKNKSDDEYYTTQNQVCEVVNKIGIEKFYNKTVVCACDDENSEFVKYFKSNKDELKYNKLFYKSKRIDDEYDFLNCDEIDFICINENVIYITNPPYSMGNGYFEKMIYYMEKNKKFQFLVFANLLSSSNVVNNINILKKFEKKEVRLYKLKDSLFLRKDSYVGIPTILYTNIKLKENKKKVKKIIKDEEGYYIINRVAEIKDEYEKMYVPITFLLDERIYDYDIESIEKKHKDGYFNFNRVKIKKRGK